MIKRTEVDTAVKIKYFKSLEIGESFENIVEADSFDKRNAFLMLNVTSKYD